jgi:hypothetical protein
VYISYRITACVIALVTGATIFRLVRRNLLHGAYAAWWLSAAAFAVLVGLFPSGFDVLGHALGVSYPPILFIILALAAFAVRMLISDLERTRMELTQRRLVQRYAHMALRLRDLERDLRARGITVPRRPGDPVAEDDSGDDAPTRADDPAKPPAQ